MATSEEGDVERALATVGAPMISYRTFEPERTAPGPLVAKKVEVAASPEPFPLLAAAFASEPPDGGEVSKEEQTPNGTTVAATVFRSTHTAHLDGMTKHAAEQPTTAQGPDWLGNTPPSRPAEVRAAGSRPLAATLPEKPPGAPTSLSGLYGSPRNGSSRVHSNGAPSTEGAGRTSLTTMFRLLTRGEPTSSKSETVLGLHDIFSRL